MIPGLCGFADLVRRQGGDVGSAELIDAAGALVLTDLADRAAVRRALALTFSWSSEDPGLFDQLFEQWFSGRDLQMAPSVEEVGGGDGDQPAVAIGAETIDAARIHADDAITVEDQGPTGHDGAGGTERLPNGSSPAVPDRDDGVPVTAPGELAPAPPRDDRLGETAARSLALVELPDAPPDAELELARSQLDAAIAQRRRPEVVVARPPVKALSRPLSAEERAALTRQVRRLDRRFDGAPSWRRARHRRGAIDVRRTMRSIVTAGGLPIELRHVGPRNNAALLVVLVDLSMSVRGTARLVLHLVHRMRSMLGSLRAFGFVDSCVSIDGALRVADPERAIERVLGLVDVDASSDPGRALRQWWARSHQLVTAETHVIVLSDGRCNGLDPSFDIVERVTRRAASTMWVSPEPEGAWTLGRGEMAEYATRVDWAVTVRTIDDLDRLVPSGATASIGRRRP